jgi:hypothetical protein
MTKKKILEIVVAEQNEQLKDLAMPLGRVACAILETMTSFDLSYESEDNWSISLGEFIILDEETLDSYSCEFLDLEPSTEKFSIDFIGAAIASEFNSGLSELGTLDVSPRYILE